MKKAGIVSIIGGVLISLVLLDTAVPADVNAAMQKSKNQFQVSADTFALSLYLEDGSELVVSKGTKSRPVANFTQDENSASWLYPTEEVEVNIKNKEAYLEVSVKALSKADAQMNWMQVQGQAYQLPLGEGRRVPAGDKDWKKYLTEQQFSLMEQFSMPFWAVEQNDNALVYISENPYRAQLQFYGQDNIEAQLIQEFPSIAKNRESTIRVYPVINDTKEIAKIYRQYVMEKDAFVSLAQKEAQNPQVKKLRGAPHIYLWNELVVAPENIIWNKLKKIADSSGMKRLLEELMQVENGEEAVNAIQEVVGQDYTSAYQKNVICSAISGLIVKNADFETNTNGVKAVKESIAATISGIEELFVPVDQWVEQETVGLLKELKKAGIEQAWIGLPNWEQAYIKPELVEEALKSGYLIAPYDSYHSIHPYGASSWNTAAFSDPSLYENATVENKDGKKIEGFQGVGRKLNPVLAQPHVEQRTEQILSSGLKFNAWFVDCDATGEVFDDYSVEHRTTMEEDIAARLKRLGYFAQQKGMVTGSEGGNDFASQDIAYAHGLGLPSFSWMDKDMSKNKDSIYYIGRYYAQNGGVPEKSKKIVPIKDFYDKIFLDPVYAVPLFRLVYQDSVIATYHWDWSTLKIENAEGQRMMTEFLYNRPPLYHLDNEVWQEQGEKIQKHVKQWSSFSQQVSNMEMTQFQVLTQDRLVQKTVFGQDAQVIANFSENPYSYEGQAIAPQSILLKINGSYEMITP